MSQTRRSVSLAFGPHKPMQQRSEDASAMDTRTVVRHLGIDPFQIVVTRSSARYDQKAVMVQSRYREVALESAAWSEQRGVSDGADRFVDLIGSEMLERCEGSGAADLEFG